MPRRMVRCGLAMSRRMTKCVQSTRVWIKVLIMGTYNKYRCHVKFRKVITSSQWDTPLDRKELLDKMTKRVPLRFTPSRPQNIYNSSIKQNYQSICGSVKSTITRKSCKIHFLPTTDFIITVFSPYSHGDMWRNNHCPCCRCFRHPPDQLSTKLPSPGDTDQK